MERDKQIKGAGLNILKEDKRDIAFGGVYKLPKISELPDEYEITPKYWKDQKGTDFCGAFSGTAVSEDQEEVELDPLYQFAMAKRISGNYKEWGIDLREMAQSFTKIGSIEQRDAPYTIDQDRDFLANPANYSLGHDQLAVKHKKKSYMFVYGFDQIRQTLWMNRNKKQTAVIGVMWSNDWGKIIKDIGTPYYGHAIKVYGWTKIDGEIYLKIQNSWGGNEPYYISKEVINANKDYGAVVFTDMPIDEAREIHDSPYLIGDNWVVQLLKTFWSLIKSLWK